MKNNIKIADFKITFSLQNVIFKLMTKVKA